jgi:hypothetical protein
VQTEVLSVREGAWLQAAVNTGGGAHARPTELRPRLDTPRPQIKTAAS